MDEGVVIEVDGVGETVVAWPRARLRKIKTPSNAAKIIPQKTNIPREEGGGRFGNWITGENTTVPSREKFNLSLESQAPNSRKDLQVKT